MLLTFLASLPSRSSPEASKLFLIFTVSFESLLSLLDPESLILYPLLQADKTNTKDNTKNKTVFFICTTPLKII